MCYYELINDIETCVLSQTLGYNYTLGSLVVLEDGSHDSGESQCRAVEGVAETDLLVFAAVTALEAVCLIRFEVADRADLEPTLLGAGPDFEVESNS